MNIICVWVCVRSEWQPNHEDDLWMTLLSCLLNHTCLLTHLQHCLVMQQDNTHTGKAGEGPIILRREKVNPLPLRSSHTLKALSEGCVSDPACQLLFIIHQADQRTPSRNSEDPDKRQSVLTIDRSSLIPHWQGIEVTGAKTHMRTQSVCWFKVYRV